MELYAVQILAENTSSTSLYLLAVQRLLEGIIAVRSLELQFRHSSLHIYHKNLLRLNPPEKSATILNYTLSKLQSNVALSMRGFRRIEFIELCKAAGVDITPG